jgi:hypothetical protein
MYKMLVLDVDGTLLDSQKLITCRNKAAIRKAIAAGVKVVISTGRSLSGVTDYLKELDLIREDEYTISCSGAIIANNTNSKLLYGAFLTQEDISLICSAAEKSGFYLNAYTRDSLLVQEECYYNELDGHLNSLKKIRVDFSDVAASDIAKMNLFTEDEAVAAYFKQCFSDVDIPIDPAIYTRPAVPDSLLDSDRISKKLDSRFNVMKTTKYTFDLTRRDTSKGSSVKLLAEKLGIKREEIICIGDSENDKQMIEYAGLGVAMGNAYDNIKAAADYVTLSNDQSGVAHVVDKFILRN